MRPLKETDPDKAAKRTNRLSLNAKIRRENWLHTINFENDDGNRQERKFFIIVIFCLGSLTICFHFDSH